MGLLDTLAVKISGQARDAVAALDKTATSAEAAAVAEAHLATTSAVLEQAQAKAAVVAAKAAGDTEALAVAQNRLAASNVKVAESKAAEGVAKATAEVTKARAATSGLAQDTGLLGSAMGKLGSLGPAAVLAAATAAGVELGKTVVGDAHSFAEATTEVQKFKNVSGATSEQASVFRAEAHGLGVDIDALATAVYKMSNNIHNTPQKFHDAGVEIAHLKNGTVDLVGTLSNAADAYNATNDQVQKNAIVSAVAGKAGQQIIPILKAGGDALKYYKDEADRRGEVFNDEQVQKGIELAIAFREVKNASEALSTTIGEKAAPELTRLELGISDVVDKANRAAQALPDIGKKAASGLVFPATFALGPVAPVVAGAVKALDFLGGGHEKAARAAATHQVAIEALMAAQQKATAEEEQYAAALDQETSAALGIVNADEAVTAANNGVAAAHKALDDAQKQAAHHSVDLARANRDAATAVRSVHDAEDKLAEARRNAPRDLVKAKEDEAAAIHSIADAQDDLTVSIAKYGSQSRQAADAQDKLNKAKETEADSQDKLNQLQKNPNKSVQDAENALADARDRANDAQQRANDLAKEDPTKAVTDAQNALTAAEDAQRDAIIRADAARKKLNDDLASGKVSASDLAGQLQNIIDLLIKAGVDQSVLKGLENLRIFVGGQVGGDTPITAPPIAVGPHVNPDSKPSSSAPDPTHQQAPGTINPFAPDPNQVPAGSTLPGRASGGPVSAGDYLIGEKGPELLHMAAGSAGVVVPNGDLHHTVIQVTVPPGTDSSMAQRTADAVAWAQKTRGLN